MIDRYLLRYFLAVVDQGAFTRAAAQCRVSQPTLSVGIAKLERLVGVKLVNRTNRRVDLTPAGVRFAVHARRIEAAFLDAQAVGDADTERSAPLTRLGVLSTLPGRWVEDALTAATAAGERMEIVEGRQKDLHGFLERGRIDAAIGIVDGDPRAQRVLFTEPYGLVLPLSHPLADEDEIEAEAVAAETMIVRRHCEALAQTSRHFTARGVRPFMAAKTTSDDRALAYVRSGLGVTVMPRGFAGDGVAIPRLFGFGVTRTIGVLVHSDAVRKTGESSGLEIVATKLRAAAALALA